MTKLYDLTSDYKQIINMVEAGELTKEQVKDHLDLIESDFNDKAVSVIHVSNSLDNDISVLDAEIKRLQAKKKSVENSKERLHDYLRNNMEASGITKIKCPQFSITLKQPAPQLHVVEQELIPDDYMVVKTSINPDKRKILADLKDGVDIPGCIIVDGKRSILIK